MNTDYIQTLRYKLQRRYRRLNSARRQVFHSNLKQFWRYLWDEPLLRGILETLKIEAGAAELATAGFRQPELETERAPILSVAMGPLADDLNQSEPETEREQILKAYTTIESCVKGDEREKEVIIGYR